MSEPIAGAGVIIPAGPDLTLVLDFFTRELGFRLEEISPADDPAVAVVAGHGLRLVLDRNAKGTAPPILLEVADPAAFASLSAPAGIPLRFVQANPPLQVPEPALAFGVRRLADGDPWVIGRAGMQYRDLIPGRLGGAVIASHIRIPDGGPVPDMVHYHTIGFQLIYCHRGWVDLVYEDQGPPFRLEAGDCVIQPPEIRHRVLYASDAIEVVEIGVPAEHVTSIDHDLELPTPHLRPDRGFGTAPWGPQRFCRSVASGAVWEPFRLPGFEARETGIAAATGGVAGVRIARASAGMPGHWARHDGGILFGFVTEGSGALSAEGETYAVGVGDAFVIPPGLATRLAPGETGMAFLEVALPAGFATLDQPPE